MDPSRKTPRVHVGTSGWHYKHWKGNFYPAKMNPAEMLQYYTERFRTVEINNSFYRLPTSQAVESWVQQTPADFIFSLKASRYITHNRKLRDPEQSFAKFFDMAKGFGRKLGPILFQLPPSWHVNEERLRDFLAGLPPTHRYAFELRNPTWLTGSIYRVLEKFNAAFCIYEIAGFQSPIEVTADFVYARLHGPGKAYQGKYDSFSLETWAKRTALWLAHGRNTFFYFDNDQAGFAAENALELSHLCGLESQSYKDIPA